ncbi:hypothetical protein EYD00_13920 [Agrobacterium sp. 33MFTa1.1]|uniref:hypothetical protein n=1 Tax=Agrobacterium sp. 33MFTa1.1 TaxID=1279031 RepID=UPI000555BF4B|nr:hypothetical protein [Agrobacterium sp. 33MFTa1.1]QBJ14614.1 hypothetical protein EYD00_13920 [Agrobacterium sp. 33MFTa1.1]
MSFEYEDIEDWDTLQQGEVFEWVGETTGDPWQRYGIIITADCDLHRRKHGGYISYLPALTTRDFIWTFWRPAILEPELDRRLAKCAVRVNKWLSKNRSKSTEISKDALEAWVKRTQPEEILDQMGCGDKGQRADLLNVIRPVHEIRECLNENKPDLAKFTAIFRLVNPAAENNPAVMHKAFQDTISGLPGDIFYIPGLPLEKHDGLFVMLRHMRQCREDDIAKKPDDIRFEGATAKRIARVSATFRYAISQNFGKVFSDIGLPEDHEVRRKGASQRFFEFVSSQ